MDTKNLFFGGINGGYPVKELYKQPENMDHYYLNSLRINVLYFVTPNPNRTGIYLRGGADHTVYLYITYAEEDYLYYYDFDEKPVRWKPILRAKKTIIEACFAEIIMEKLL